MRITVKFFASLQEKFKQPEIELELPQQQATVAEIWQHVSHKQHVPATILSAINLEYSQADDVVNDGDEIAFFPPVTGG